MARQRRTILWQVDPITSDTGMAGNLPVNCYAEQGPRNDKTTNLVMRGAPGTLLWTTLSTLPVQGIYPFNGVLLAVADGVLYSINMSLSITTLGLVPFLAGANNLSFSDNGISVVIVGSTGAGYAYTDTVGIEDLSTRDGWQPATHVTFIDGRFVFCATRSGQWFISELYSTTFDPLDFATAESYPDNLSAVARTHQYLWLLGESSIEPWYSSGGFDFQFQRVNSAVLDIGCKAPYSVSSHKDVLYWLGDDGIFYRMMGLRLQRISSHFVENYLRNREVRDASAWCYSSNGHDFYVVTLPSLDQEYKTLVYDATTNLWHFRTTVSFGRHVGCCYARFHEYDLVGDFQSGRILQLDQHAHEDNGDPQVLTVETADEYAGGEDIPYPWVEVDCAQGFGGSIMLSYSEDGGKTWFSKPDMALGAVGYYSHSVRWTRLGRSKRRRYRVKISDAVPRSIRALMVGVPIGR